MKKKVHSLFRSRLLVLSVVVFLQSSTQHIQAQPYSLNNDIIRLSFNEHGLQSLTDKRLAKTFTFSSDRFVVSLNGKNYDSSLTKLKGIEPSADKLIYLYTVPGYTIRVIYELDSTLR